MRTCERAFDGVSRAHGRFASAILLRPSQVVKQHSSEKSFPEMSQYDQQVEMKRRFKTMLENEAMIPRVCHLA